MTDAPEAKENILNENVGVLGHIDAGKTALCRRLSEIASTAGLLSEWRDTALSQMTCFCACCSMFLQHLTKIDKLVNVA